MYNMIFLLTDCIGTLCYFAVLPVVSIWVYLGKSAKNVEQRHKDQFVGWFERTVSLNYFSYPLECTCVLAG